MNGQRQQRNTELLRSLCRDLGVVGIHRTNDRRHAVFVDELIDETSDPIGIGRRVPEEQLNRQVGRGDLDPRAHLFSHQSGPPRRWDEHTN